MVLVGRAVEDVDLSGLGNRKGWARGQLSPVQEETYDTLKANGASNSRNLNSPASQE